MAFCICEGMVQAVSFLLGKLAPMQRPARRSTSVQAMNLPKPGEIRSKDFRTAASAPTGNGKAETVRLVQWNIERGYCPVAFETHCIDPHDPTSWWFCKQGAADLHPQVPKCFRDDPRAAHEA